MNFNNIRILGWITLLGFGLFGMLLIWWLREDSIEEFLMGQYPISIQILTGVFYGIFCGYVAWYIVSRKFMKSITNKYAKILGRFKLSVYDVWFISFCAGVGEELFFRGGLQPLLGIWITAIVFVAIHGYLNPTNWRISIYGVIMIFLMAGLGYLTEEVGIISAMSAHMIIDVILLKKLVAWKIPFSFEEEDK